MRSISLTRFNRFRDSLPADSEPPRKYVDQYRTVQEFEQLRDYLRQVGERVVPAGDSVRAFRETLSNQDGQLMRARGIARGGHVLRLDLESDGGLNCRYRQANGKHSWTVAGPGGATTTYQLAGDTLSVSRR